MLTVLVLNLIAILSVVWSPLIFLLNPGMDEWAPRPSYVLPTYIVLLALLGISSVGIARKVRQFVWILLSVVALMVLWRLSEYAQYLALYFREEYWSRSDAFEPHLIWVLTEGPRWVLLLIANLYCFLGPLGRSYFASSEPHNPSS